MYFPHFFFKVGVLDNPGNLDDMPEPLVPGHQPRGGGGTRSGRRLPLQLPGGARGELELGLHFFNSADEKPNNQTAAPSLFRTEVYHNRQKARESAWL